MSGGRLDADVEQYLRAATTDTPPPQILSDPLVAGVTPVEQLLRVLGLAANLGDPQDNATGAEHYAERGAKTREAAGKFAAQDEQAADELSSLDGEPFSAVSGTATAPDQITATIQQIPQMASGIAGALTGAIGGALQPLAQLPQQAAQGLQQVFQSGLLEQTADTGAAPPEDAVPAEDPLDEDQLDEDFGDETVGGFGGVVGGTDSGGGLGAGSGDMAPPGGTAPMAYLGPPPVPSAGTAPSSAPIAPVPPPAATPSAGHGTTGMAGMPMVPPGAMTPAAGPEKDPKTETKRVSVPPVRNGAPVQGRLAVPPAAPPVTQKSEGKPVVARRVVAPGRPRSGDAAPDS